MRGDSTLLLQMTGSGGKKLVVQFGLLGDGIILLRGGIGIGMGSLEGTSEGAVDIVVRDEVEVEETLAIGGRHSCDAEEQQPSNQIQQATRDDEEVTPVRRKEMRFGPGSDGRDG